VTAAFKITFQHKNQSAAAFSRAMPRWCERSQMWVSGSGR